MYEEFQVAISIILQKEGKILLGKRSETQDFAQGIWEFPAGRIEKGETPEEAIAREGMEELGITIHSSRVFDVYRFERNGVTMLLLNFMCESNDEPKVSEEHDELRWVTPEQAKDLFSFNRQKKTVDLYIQAR